MLNSLILDLIFPIKCFSCHRFGHYFCPDCHSLQKINHLKIKNITPLEGLLSLYPYHGAIRQIIKSIKFEFCTEIVEELSSYLASDISTHFPNLVKYWHQANFTLVPIPLHPYRQNWRGFNQSSLLGKYIAQSLNIQFSDDFLIRSKDTTPQSSFHHRHDRHSNVKQAFQLNQQLTAPSNIILFDDVFTSGSTLKSAAATFPKKTSIWGLTIAG